MTMSEGLRVEGLYTAYDRADVLEDVSVVVDPPPACWAAASARLATALGSSAGTVARAPRRARSSANATKASA